jgi:diguanylate cyclase
MQRIADMSLKYDHSIERSTELLRLAVPLMSRQSAARHPMSYAVWYEYAAGSNAALHAAVDAQLALHGQLDEASTEALFRQHVADHDPVAAQRMADGMRQVLTGMAESAAQVREKTARFGNTLEALHTELEQGQPGSAVSQALQGTREMREAMSSLHHRLAESQREIATLRAQVQRAQNDALVDALTGLANRRAFDQRMSELLSTRIVDPQAPEPVLAVADIDHFKRINDTFGHNFGDQVLRAVAQALAQVAGQQALVARTGGEEFSLLMAGASVDQGRQLAEAVRATVASSRVRRKGVDEVLERVTLSLGVAQYRGSESALEFIERADQALYAAKQGGRDRVVVSAH